MHGDVVLDPARRVVFKTVGMPWEDLTVARVVGGGGECEPWKKISSVRGNQRPDPCGRAFK